MKDKKKSRINPAERFKIIILLLLGAILGFSTLNVFLITLKLYSIESVDTLKGMSEGKVSAYVLPEDNNIQGRVVVNVVGGEK